MHVPGFLLHSLPTPELNRARSCTPERRRPPWPPPRLGLAAEAPPAPLFPQDRPSSELRRPSLVLPSPLTAAQGLRNVDAAAQHRSRPQLAVELVVPPSPRPKTTSGMASPRPNGAPKPSHLHPWPPERRRAGAVPPLSAGVCGAAASDLLPANQGHPEVRLSPLYLFPTLTLAAGEPGRRKTKHRSSPLLFPPPRTSREKKQKSRGLDAKVRFLFLLFSKTANL